MEKYLNFESESVHNVKIVANGWKIRVKKDYSTCWVRKGPRSQGQVWCGGWGERPQNHKSLHINIEKLKTRKYL